MAATGAASGSAARWVQEGGKPEDVPSYIRGLATSVSPTRQYTDEFAAEDDLRSLPASRKTLLDALGVHSPAKPTDARSKSHTQLHSLSSKSTTHVSSSHSASLSYAAHPALSSISPAVSPPEKHLRSLNGMHDSAFDASPIPYSQQESPHKALNNMEESVMFTPGTSKRISDIMSQMSSQMEQKTRIYESRNKDFDELARKFAEFERKRDESLRSLRDEISRRDAEISLLHAATTRVQAERDTALGRVGTLNEELEQLKNRYKLLSSEKDGRIEQLVQENTQLNERIGSHDAKIAQLQLQYNASIEEVRRLTHETIAEHEQALAVMQTQMESHLADSTQLSRSREELGRSLQRAEAAARAAEEKNARLAHALETVQRTANESMRQHEACGARHAALQADFEAVSMRLATEQAAVQQLQSERSVLEDTATTAARRVETLAAQLAQAQAQRDASARRADEEHVRVEESRSMAAAERTRLGGALQTALEETSQLRTQTVGLREEVRTQGQLAQEQTNAANGLRGQLSECERRLQQAEHDRQLLATDLESERAKANAAEQRLKFDSVTIAGLRKDLDTQRLDMAAKETSFQSRELALLSELQQARAQLAAHQQALEEHLQKRRVELDEQTRSLRTTEVQVVVQRESIAQLEDAVHRKTLECESIEAELRSVKARAKDSGDRAAAEIQELRKQLQAANDELNQLREEMARLRAANDGLAGQVDAVRADHQSTERELRGLLDEKHSLIAQMAVDKQQALDIAAERTAELGREIAQLKGTLASRQESFNAVVADNNALREQLSKLQIRLEENSQMISLLRSQLEDAEAGSAQSKATIISLEQTIKTMSAGREEERRSFEAKQLEMQTLLQRQDALFTTDRIQHDESINAITRELDEQRRTVTVLRNQISDLNDALSKECKSRAGAVAAARQEGDAALANAGQIAGKTIESLQNLVRDKEARIQELENHLTAARSDIENRVRSLSREHLALMSEREKLQLSVDELHSRLERSVEEHTAVVNQLQKNNADLKRRITVLEGALLEKTAAVEQASAYLAHAQSEVAELSKKLEEVNTAMRQLRGEKETAEARLNSVVQQLEAVNALLDTTNSEHDRLKNQRELLIEEKTTRITTLKQELQDLANNNTARLQRLQSQLDAMTKEKIEKTAQLAQAHTRCTRLEENLHQKELGMLEMTEIVNGVRRAQAEKDAQLLHTRGELEVALEQKRLLEAQLDTFKTENDRAGKRLKQMNEDKDRRIKALEGRHQLAEEEQQQRLQSLEYLVQQLRAEVADKDLALTRSQAENYRSLAALNEESSRVSMLTNIVGRSNDEYSGYDSVLNSHEATSTPKMAARTVTAYVTRTHTSTVSEKLISESERRSASEA